MSEVTEERRDTKQALRAAVTASKKYTAAKARASEAGVARVEAILAAIDAGNTRVEISRATGIRQSFISRMVRLAKEGKPIEPETDPETDPEAEAE